MDFHVPGLQLGCDLILEAVLLGSVWHGHDRPLDQLAVHVLHSDSAQRGAGIGGDGGEALIQDNLIHVLRIRPRYQVDGCAAEGIAEHGREVLQPVAGAVHGDREAGLKVCTAHDVPSPLEAERQEHPRLAGLGPCRVAEGVLRDVPDILSMVLHPLDPIIERQLVQLLTGLQVRPHQASAHDSQPASSLEAYWFALGEQQE